MCVQVHGTEYIMIEKRCNKYVKFMIKLLVLDYRPRKGTTFVIQIDNKKHNLFNKVLRN